VGNLVTKNRDKDHQLSVPRFQTVSSTQSHLAPRSSPSGLPLMGLEICLTLFTKLREFRITSQSMMVLHHSMMTFTLAQTTLQLYQRKSRMVIPSSSSHLMGPSFINTRNLTTGFISGSLTYPQINGIRKSTSSLVLLSQGQISPKY